MQGTPEWFAMRAGKVTASRIKDVMATIKTGEAASRRNYRAQLVAERLTGLVEPGYTNGAMQWGTDNEPIARARYESERWLDVEQVDFVDHPTIPMTGASPDGLVGESGLIEIKCPNTATHIDYLLAGVPPADYHLQMLWQMACTGREWCDFVSFDPRMPENIQLFVARFKRDDKRIEEIEVAVSAFLAEVDETVKKLKEL